MSTTTELAEKVAEHVQTSSEALGLSVDLLNKYRADEKVAEEKQAAVAARVPTLVEKLAELQLIDAGDEKQAAAELGDHIATLELVNDLLDKYAALVGETSKSARLGKGVNGDGVAPQTTKKAFHAIGERSFTRDRESDKAIARLAGR